MLEEIDLLIVDANIETMCDDQPTAEAIAINNGKILEVGSTNELKLKYIKVKKILDLNGEFLCPGFNDTHTHLLAMSAKFQDVMLDEVTSPIEALEKIAERVKTTPKGKWIFGERWDESNWDEKRFLTLEELDKIAPENPCFIRRVCGHLVAINSLALEELGIALDDPDLPINPNTKKPLGYIKDELINRLADEPKLKITQEDLDKAVLVACKYANSLGVTSCTDNLSTKSVNSYMKTWKENQLTVRIYMNIPRTKFSFYLETGLKTGFGDEFLKFGGVKIFTDGSLGSHTAALKEPYHIDPSTTGKFYIEKEIFFDTIKTAIENGWQTATHAIGDDAIDFVIKAFENITDSDLIKKGRHRIEHAEYLLDDQLNRVNKLGLILSMQPNFPGRWGKPGQLYEQCLGPERYKLLNPFRKINASKTKVCFGSDNMPMSPIFGIFSVASHPIEGIKISAKEALYYFTLGAAYSSFEEDIKGSIEPGKLADFVVLDKDILKIPPEEINDTKVLMTIVNGEIVFP
ncbi:MAG: amidohydrolase [Candidatus Heimdallarchaeota archaeon]|nr:amidohydrolase [Candidatus Heimdallarchaeota archaeon]